MRSRYTDRARDDIELTFAWYERQRRGLGFEFLDCIELPHFSETREDVVCDEQDYGGLIQENDGWFSEKMAFILPVHN